MNSCIDWGSTRGTGGHLVSGRGELAMILVLIFILCLIIILCLIFIVKLVFILRFILIVRLIFEFMWLMLLG